MNRSVRGWFVRSLFLVTAILPLPGRGEEIYLVKNLVDLTWTEGQLSQIDEARSDRSPFSWRMQRVMIPYAVLDDGGEVYLGWSPSPAGGFNRDLIPDTTKIALPVPSGTTRVSGQLFWPKANLKGHVRLKFQASFAGGESSPREEFLRVKRDYYANLWQRDLPGSAWFRHQVRDAQRELGEKPGEETAIIGRRSPRDGANDLTATFSLFSGGRALSENLQLDRVIPTSGAGVETVTLESIAGISVRGFDWTPRLPPQAIGLDPLAKLIPEDQHAIFFPSFKAMLAIADHSAEFGTPIVEWVEPRAESALTRQRYEQQLGVALDAATRLLGPTLIRSVALTGGDPYFRTGTDVALLFDAIEASVVQQFVVGQIKSRAAAVPDAQSVEGELQGTPYVGTRTPDRGICSYVAVIDHAVVVTNSLIQLGRLIETHAGTTGSLHDSPEFTFFRARYPRDTPHEAALVVLTDQTIRRWCGPRWRIGSSRRTRALGVMSELQANYLDSLVAQSVKPGPLHAPDEFAIVGELALAPRGLQSSTYGTLDFQTPIIELDLEKVTREESDLYALWRDGYQRCWNNYFDPIAIQFRIEGGKLAGDMTVMPLISASDYRSYVDVSRGAKLRDDQGDPHADAISHWVMAINPKSDLLRRQTGMLRAMTPEMAVDPLNWLGESVAVYFDQEPTCSEIAKSASDPPWMRFPFHRLPIAIHADVRNGFALTAFLAAARAFIEQSAPGMTVWESKKCDEEPYVRISTSERGRSSTGGLEDLALHYWSSGDALIVSLREDTLQRAIRRQIAIRKAKADGKSVERETPSWIGENMCLQVNSKALEALAMMFADDQRSRTQDLAWANLPILNEWKRRYPDQNPLEFHERFWGTRLVCPGEGQYVWNEEWRTMESTVLGHPGESKGSPPFPPGLAQLAFGNFGLTFEQDGLRARMELTQEPQGGPEASATPP